MSKIRFYLHQRDFCPSIHTSKFSLLALDHPPEWYGIHPESLKTIPQNQVLDLLSSGVDSVNIADEEGKEAQLAQRSISFQQSNAALVGEAPTQANAALVGDSPTRRMLPLVSLR